MNDQRYEIALDRDGGRATLFLPLPLSEKDLNAVAKWCEYVRILLRDEAPEALDGGTE